MRIPTNPEEREFFYLDLINKCEVSKSERQGDYASLRSYFLFGAGPEESPAPFNKIGSHIDQLSSFLYSAETTRFNIALGAGVDDIFHRYVPTLTQALHDEWNNSNADQVFSTALIWSLVFNSTFIKLIPYNTSIQPYLVDPATIGVLREDVPYTDRQQAFTQEYYMTKHDLYSRLYAHPKRDQIVSRISTGQYTPQQIPDGIDRIVMSQTNPTLYGTVNLDLYGYNRMKIGRAHV